MKLKKKDILQKERKTGQKRERKLEKAESGESTKSPPAKKGK